MLKNIAAIRKAVPVGRQIHGLLKSLVSVVSSHQARNAAQREDDVLDSIHGKRMNGGSNLLILLGGVDISWSFASKPNSK